MSSTIETTAPSSAARVAPGPDNGSPTYAELAAKYRPAFESIAAGAAGRETDRVLLHEQIGELAAAGFGAARVPREFGGDGATAVQLFRLLIELAAAESNLAQALRSHIAFVEGRLYANDAEWLRRVGEGQILGNAWTETGAVTVGGVGTTIEPDGGNFRVNGTKYYTTGSLYADWIQTGARTADGRDIIALVRADAPGVTIHDDWDGFGQRLTASGTAVFENVAVPASDILVETEQAPYATGVYQLIHVATLAGITQRVVRDVSEAVRERTRVFSHGNGVRPSEDIQIQQIVGEIAAQAFAAEAATLRVAELLQEAFDLRPGIRTDGTAATASDAAPPAAGASAFEEAVLQVEFGSSQAQIVVTDLAQRASSSLFDALGASATQSELQLDRHWRNARVISSHNPVVYKSRVVGDWKINGSVPEFVWRSGTA
ncbi:acyl-CoA dehydrogenase family protein [Arthrobacter crystallopoietes]|uniref:acyl-CoA dehydrogenase family protein n=1 Tax=Crystallibacter crystallopoietes TaxID=37928 RepID=UPI0011113668|nr:acyl-CoA dehydrogenase family protein [Arthrobacter crystallopoietes]QTG81324.1 acyl-CoA dehydrogenase family protein [Arthrobacter crystallopoietes]